MRTPRCDLRQRQMDSYPCDFVMDANSFRRSECARPDLLYESAYAVIAAFAFIGLQPAPKCAIHSLAWIIDLVCLHLNSIWFWSEPCPEASLLFADGGVQLIAVEFIHHVLRGAFQWVEAFSQHDDSGA